MTMSTGHSPGAAMSVTAMWVTAMWVTAKWMATHRNYRTPQAARIR